jgi:cellulose synthase/poly-beta-1,6-N-acetylglucosamine synthase-like glycosyltransferase
MIKPLPDLEIPLGKRTRFYRAFEMIPALLSYVTILLPVLFSLINPLIGAVFVIVYIIVWFVKSIAVSVRSVQGFNILTRAQAVAWRARLDDLETPEESLRKWHQNDEWKADIHRHNLERLAASEGARKPSDILNVIIIATYNESIDVLEPTVESLLASDYDMGQAMLVIAYEERGGADIEKTAKLLEKKYRHAFKYFYAIKHPADLPDEVVGKGANITYAGRLVEEAVRDLAIDPENVIVTTLDSDNRPHKTYFSYLTYEYIMHPEPRYASFQPLSLYLNNIWDVPAPIRVLATGNSFWNIVVSQRPNMLRNFASHSQSLAALIDTDFWSVRTIVEDGHQFWRSYFRYDGHYSVTPIYVPIYQDAVMSEKLVHTLKAQFVQLRRWAYGASDIPYVAERVLTRKRTAPFWDAFFKFIRLVDSHISWASAPFILLLGAFAPLFLSSESSRSIIAHQLPSIASGVQQIALVGLVVIIVLSFRMLPDRPKAYTWRRNVSMLLQWFLAPILGIVYSSAASLYSQTRLLLGKYLDKFDVTEKVVVQHEE